MSSKQFWREDEELTLLDRAAQPGMTLETLAEEVYKVSPQGSIKRTTRGIEQKLKALCKARNLPYPLKTSKSDLNLKLFQSRLQPMPTGPIDPSLILPPAPVPVRLAPPPGGLPVRAPPPPPPLPPPPATEEKKPFHEMTSEELRKLAEEKAKEEADEADELEAENAEREWKLTLGMGVEANLEDLTAAVGNVVIPLLRNSLTVQQDFLAEVKKWNASAPEWNGGEAEQ
eukprot:TRINITY_DN58318_c0_g1_i1.p1 TRINITY_DN58318_c0_g1~~TRINITY_DN58318_c0_g1_i1.p1  ORF type:complete len:229 (-),score=39.68 TRINITY_DN58318_c0_g1_i1:246-932(-)